ncbi:hypothetical protein EDE11_10614 [Methylomonas methanica]|uniref:Uncharacterized protein n=1 Tax=Methylomonas methanica TaxID=421 RepID=A0ABY2CN79_METMH|nr:hypothetical protein EDE11_10614 [Methylomonas methanica]
MNGPSTLQKSTIGGIYFANGILSFSVGELVLSTLLFGTASISCSLILLDPLVL